MSHAQSLLFPSHGDDHCADPRHGATFDQLAESNFPTCYEPNDLTEMINTEGTPIFFHRPSMTSTYDSAESIATPLLNRIWTMSKCGTCWLHHCTYRREKQVQTDHKFYHSYREHSVSSSSRFRASSWFGCPALLHVLNSLRRTCGSTFHVAPTGETARENRPRALIFQRRVAYAVHWVGPVGETPTGSRRGLLLRPGRRHPGGPLRADASRFAFRVPCFARLSWFSRRNGHRSWGCGTGRDPGVPVRMGVVLFSLRFLSFGACVPLPGLFCIRQQGCLGCVPTGITCRPHGCACSRDCFGDGRARHGTYRGKPRPWHEQDIRRRFVEAQ